MLIEFLILTNAFFFQTTAENLRCCLTASSKQDESGMQRGNGKVLEFPTLELKSIMVPK